ncbi:adapter molecule crk-like [Protopterus annectens]|uniref:adapter molecule crk-like n=1 Tax=Protopterus annectens TaxID=7888 RepID=UPI001CF9CE4B|nr:adapter molecule crk-like [Protopterus annectens]
MASKMASRLYETCHWYCGAISRKQADKLLRGKEHGTYLVRDSSTCPKDYVLSVSENHKVSHYIIHSEQGRLKIGDLEFEDLPVLLEFYKDHYLDTTPLTKPVTREKPPVCLITVTPPLLEEDLVMALYDFSGKDEEDLPFKKGEIMKVLVKDEEQWWTAENRQGQRGVIPVPYVKKYTQSTESSQFSLSGDKSYLNVQPVQQKLPKWAKAIQQRQPNAYDTTALGFEVGDLILVTKMNTNGQWEGELNGRRGHFPFTYVQIVNSQGLKEDS